MTLFPDDALRHDSFLGGSLQLWQPRQGYRAGVDPVLLAATVPAKVGQSVLDLGCGAGAAALCLGTRVAGLKLFGVERHPGYAQLAKRNGAEAGQRFDVFQADVSDMPAVLKGRNFEHVIANPPYYDRASGSASRDSAREAALGEDTPLEVWVKTAAKRLKPWGYLHMIIKADRLADLLACLRDRLGSLEILPLAPRQSRASELVIVRARKEGRAKLKLHAPIVMHEGAEHPGDQDHYSDRISAVLRRGAALEF